MYPTAHVLSLTRCVARLKHACVIRFMYQVLTIQASRVPDFRYARNALLQIVIINKKLIKKITEHTNEVDCGPQTAV